MARMVIVVCLPGEDRSRLEEAVAEAMAPFELDYSGDEAFDIWDGWRIQGGVHGGGFELLPGYADDPRLVHEDPGPSLPGRCAGGPREALALAEIRAEGAAQAAAAWDLWQELVPLHPPFVPEREVPQPWSNPEEFRIEMRAQVEARVAFDAQPLVLAYREGMSALQAAHRGHDLTDILHGGSAHAVARLGRREFVAEETACLPYFPYVLTLDGWWCGEEGPVHGACDGPDSCPHPAPIAEPYRYGAARYLEALPGDTLLVLVRCHL
ncbi:hypothetical protein [Streptomyces sp. AP-93]|uniref:hypothetical protein n=1 Tax=Streptomyces sp. AP-93 TaxID=2929048 RepID=UPI001FAF0512|nr:hypothetical protein [Streptomyces sp. AP-93]MCJ0875342.1 hypothetical protein [Streptomyces sp. AP-93]